MWYHDYRTLISTYCTLFRENEIHAACKFTELHRITQDYTELQPNVPDYADLQGVANELQGVAVEVRGGAPKNDSKVCYKDAIAFFIFKNKI